MAIDAGRDVPACRGQPDGSIDDDCYRVEAASLRRQQVSLLLRAFVAALKPRPAPQPARERSWRSPSWRSSA